MPGDKHERIGNTEVLNVETVGGFVVKKLASEMPNGAIEAGSKEAEDIVEQVAEKMSIPRSLKTTVVRKRPVESEDWVDPNELPQDN